MTLNQVSWLFWALHTVQALDAVGHGHSVTAACYAVAAVASLWLGHGPPHDRK